MNFEAYTGKELQHFLAMLNQCESGGVTDIRFVRERLQNHINARLRDNRVIALTARKYAAVKKPVCPKCGSSKWVRETDEVDGSAYYECKCCRHVEVVR